MPPDNVEVVERAVAAINERDIAGYLACCTDALRLWPTSLERMRALMAFGASNVYDLVDGKIKRIRVFFDREEAVKAAGRTD